MGFHAATIFLSAFLLFQVQPLIARLILPWFGGSAAVWTTCMLFFQVLLLAGYLYAYLSVKYLRPGRQAALHIILLAASLLFLPIVPSASWKPPGAETPIIRILGLLTATVGAPYLLLSATTPLLQAWYARTCHRSLPYRLFSLSNAASLLALLSYPALMEPFLATRSQAFFWSSGYLLFAILCGVTAFRSRAGEETPAATISLAGAGIVDPLLWTLLPAASTALLLAVTTHLSQNVASIPFLWILPLSIYLLSFILCFEGERWYRRSIWYPLAAVGLAAMTIGFAARHQVPAIRVLVPLFSLGLFSCCMLLHGELAALKPEPRRLTTFYVMTSLGGALGGLFAGIAAPLLFSDYHELPAALAATGLLAAAALYRSPPRLEAEQAKTVQLVTTICAGALSLYLPMKAMEDRWGTIRTTRNFYGVLKVSESPDGKSGAKVRTLIHGVISHGQQFLSEGLRRQPVAYYGELSGVGRSIALQRGHSPLSVGVIGLGAGTVAAYGRPGDRFRFYEINPLVLSIARSDFTYLGDCRAGLEVVMGDARLSLEREKPNRFDVLAVDAFSGDAIPVHLVTREALSLYFSHLKEDGLLAIHITNRYLDLEPVLAEGLASIGKSGVVVKSVSDPEKKAYACDWIVAGAPAVVGRLIGKGISPVRRRDRFPCWTDDYGNLLQVLK